MLFSVFYVGDSCQGWGSGVRVSFPAPDSKKSPHLKMGAFFMKLTIHIQN